MAPLKEAFGEAGFAQIEFVAADLLDAESIDRAVAGQDVVVHCASPLPLGVPSDEQVLIKPALEGTLAVMRAAQKHGVKRVVITSSGLTITLDKQENWKKSYNEDDWSDPDCLGPYEKSKYLAEKAAWDFVAALPEDQRFELVSVIPSLVLGPPLIKGDYSSGNYLKMLLQGKMPALPRIKLAIVDVREVA